MASKGPRKNAGIPAAPAPVVAAPKLPTPVMETSPLIEQAIAAAVDPVSVAEAAPKIAETAAEKIEATVTETAKDLGIMATTFESTVNKSQTLFADINERSKAAVEKSAKLVEEFNDFAKGNVEAVVESGRITAKGLEVLGQDAAEYSRRSFETATAALKNMASVKSPADFFRLQGEFLRGAFDSYVAEASKGTEAVLKLAGDAAQPIQNRFAIAAEKVKVAA